MGATERARQDGAEPGVGGLESRARVRVRRFAEPRVRGPLRSCLYCVFCVCVISLSRAARDGQPIAARSRDGGEDDGTADPDDKPDVL